MLNSGKNFALCATKKNILTLVLSELMSVFKVDISWVMYQ